MQGKCFALSNASQSSSTTIKMFIHSTHTRISMLYTTSAAGPVSSLIGESSAIAQTAMHTKKAPKHVPCANVKSSQYIKKERPTHISHLWMEGIANQLSPNRQSYWFASCSFFLSRSVGGVNYLSNPSHLGLVDKQSSTQRVVTSNT